MKIFLRCSYHNLYFLYLLQLYFKDMTDIDSAFVLKELRKGNKNAFELVFKKYYSSLCVYANKYCRDESTSEEIVSRFFFNFYEKRESLKIDTSLRSYLFRSVRNAALNYIRDNARTVSEQDSKADVLNLNSTDSVHETLLGKELQEVIDKAVDSLPDQCRAVFVKSRFEGKKYKEIAEELNISVNTVETQMSRALKKLRVELKDYMHIMMFLIG